MNEMVSLNLSRDLEKTTYLSMTPWLLIIAPDHADYSTVESQGKQLTLSKKIFLFSVNRPKDSYHEHSKIQSFPF